jgi:hypothetical protein
MRYCPECLVGLADDATRCPLCGSPPVAQIVDREGREAALAALAAATPFAPEVRDADEAERLEPAQLRKLLVELSAVSLGIAVVSAAAVDFIFSQGFTWSRQATIALAFAWLAFSMPLVFWRRPWLTFSVLGPSALAAVFLWFLASGRLDLFLALGLPIAALAEAIAVGLGVLVAIEKPRGLNVVGTLISGMALLCVGIDAVAGLHGAGVIALAWSRYIAIVALPVAGLFFYLHYRVVNHASLSKIFRL